MHYPLQLVKLIEYLKKFPGVGQKSAERFAFYLLEWDTTTLQSFANLLSTIKEKILTCHDCGCLINKDTCSFCNNPNRNQHVLCIAASTKDVFAIEDTASFQGVYYVLGTLFSPLDGKDVHTLNIDAIKDKISSQNVQEIIFALDSTVEGDATTLFLKQELKSFDLKISRLAFGLPVGSALEYTDTSTLSRALIGRLPF